MSKRNRAKNSPAFNLGFYNPQIKLLSTNGIFSKSKNLDMYYGYKARKLFCEHYDWENYAQEGMDGMVNQIKDGIVTRMKKRFFTVKNEWIKINKSGYFY